VMLPLLKFFPCRGHTPTLLVLVYRLTTSDAATPEIFSVPRPHDGTLDFVVEPASRAALLRATEILEITVLVRVFMLLIEGALRPLAKFFPLLAHKTAHWISVLRPFRPLL